jgi:PAS domain S-box-containing protein
VRPDQLPDFPALEYVPDAVIVADTSNHIRYSNPAVSKLLGWSADDLVDQPLTMLIPQRLRAAHEAGFARFSAGQPMRRAGVAMRVAALHRDGHEVEIDLVLGAVPGPDGERWAIGALRDLTERIALEREVRIGRYLRASTEVASALQAAAIPEVAFDALLPALCENLDWELAAIWQRMPGTSELICTARWHDGTLPAASAAMTKGIVLRTGEGLPGEVWSSRRPTLISMTQPHREIPRAQIAHEHQLVTGLAFPLQGSTGPLGVVEFWSRQEHVIDGDLNDVLLSIGHQLGVFIERTVAETELRLALDVIQSSLLPSKLPVIPGIRVATHYQPGGRAGIGGDFFDVFALPDGRWAIVIADVCGKGAGAATVTAVVRYTLRAAAIEHAEPANLLDIVNQALLDEPTARPFVTACLVVLEPAPAPGLDSKVTITVAGHPLPMLRTADGAVRNVGEPGDLLGVLESPSFHPSSVALPLGATLLLYTDGFTEARDIANVQLGEGGLARLLSPLSQSDPVALLDALVTSLARHTTDRETIDDAAAVAITPE